MYDDILIPTDGSRAAEAAIDHALGLASTYDARVHTLYVVDVNVYGTLETGTDVVVSALEREGEEAVERIAEAVAEAGLEATTSVVTGTPYREIVDYADEEGVDLIVMGTHGRRGLDRYLLGSVAEKVLRSTETPVLTVHWDGDEEDES